MRWRGYEYSLPIQLFLIYDDFHNKELGESKENFTKERREGGREEKKEARGHCQ